MPKSLFGKSENFIHQASAYWQNGGAERDRTDDLMLAKHALSQLSYSPEFCSGPSLEKVAPSRMKIAAIDRKNGGPGKI